MTRVEREQMISRYLGGELSTAEEQDFFIRVAVDKELRQDLRAQRTIDSALRKDRDAESTGHTAVRMRVAAMLAATPGAGSSTPAEPLPRASAGAADGLAGSSAASGIVATKWLVTVAVGALVAAAVLVLPDALDDSVTSQDTSRTSGSVNASSQSPSRSSAAEQTAPTPAAANAAGAAESAGVHDDVASRHLQQPTVKSDRRSGVTYVRTKRADADATIAPRRAVRSSRGIDDAESTALDTMTDASALDRRDKSTLDDSIDIGIKLRIPKE